ncbi:Imm30 family immunity protein [Clostridium butyricum]|uniref:Imm30 family immunity protein n=1 Tax=Clostridium butyricum TaxID=1492 RepID=UPI001CC416F0|nr:Imm30 family immunity protein [Clostridium butyricum]MBZ5747913.1 immunity 30 family protein [Clostridium butyricum]
MKNEEEIEEFENAIEKIVKLQDVKLISKMCRCFDDKCENIEVMYGLVHAIEIFECEEYFEQVIMATQSMLQNAKMWVRTIYYGILNDELSRKIFIDVLKNRVDSNNRLMVISLLEKIRHEKPNIFTGSVNEVINSII